jgi:hypothetical protein
MFYFPLLNRSNFQRTSRIHENQDKIGLLGMGRSLIDPVNTFTILADGGPKRAAC